MVGLAPLLLVRSAGSDRTKVTFTCDRGTYYFDVIIFVQQAGWTDAEACDAVDLIEWLVSEEIDGNRSSDYVINYLKRSIVDEYTDSSGAVYYREVIPIEVKVT
jgi:hypothetical protein